MPLTRQESRNELLNMKLPAAVIAIFDGQPPHSSLSFRCKDPFYIFGPPPVEPGGIHVTPLWECGIIVTAYQHSQPQGRFLEDSKNVTVIGASFNAVAADLLIDLFEDEESIEELREVARLFEFRHFDELLQEFSQPRSGPGRLSYDEYEARRARFLEYCDTAV